MTATSKLPLPPSIKAAITRLCKAEREAAFAGAAHPDDHDAILENAERARDRLKIAIESALQWRAGR